MIKAGNRISHAARDAPGAACDALQAAKGEAVKGKRGAVKASGEAVKGK